MANQFWTQEQDSTLLDLWNQGKTAKQIALVVGKTRNAVIGRAHRLRLDPRENPIKAAVKPMKKQPGRVVIIPTTTAYTATGYAGFMHQVQHKLCQFIAGDVKKDGVIYCQHPATHGAYCEEHAAVCSSGVKLKPVSEWHTTARRKA